MVTCWWNDNGIQRRVPTIPAVQEQSLGISGFGMFVESNPILNVHHSTMLRHPKAPVNIPRTPSLEFGQGLEGLPNSDGRCSDDLGEDVSKECQMFAAFPAVLYWWKLDTKMSWLQSSDSSRLHKTPELKTLVTLQILMFFEASKIIHKRSLGIWLCSSCAKTDKTCTSPWTPPKGRPSAASKRCKAHVSWGFQGNR